MIFTRAWEFKSKVAIVSDGEHFTYAYLAKTASNLSQNILGKLPDLNESRIVFLCPSGFDYVVTQWAIWMAGGIAVPLCALHPYESMAYVVEDCQADTIIIHEAFLKILKKLA